MSKRLSDARIWSGIGTQKLVNSANEYEAKLPNDSRMRDLVIRIRREIARRAKADRAAELMAFADHIYAASEPNPIGEYLEDEAREWEEDNGGIDLDASEPIKEDTMTAEDRKKQLESPIKPDYEPEQAYGSADDFRRHQQYGGTREDY